MQIPVQNDPVAYAENMVRQSGGDARAAFYAAAQEKGVDPEQFIAQMKNSGSLQGLAMAVMQRNPRAKSLLSLFGSSK